MSSCAEQADRKKAASTRTHTMTHSCKVWRNHTTNNDGAGWQNLGLKDANVKG